MAALVTDRDIAQAILRAVGVATAFLSGDEHKSAAFAAAIAEAVADAEDVFALLAGLLVVIREIFEHTEATPDEILPRIALEFVGVR